MDALILGCGVVGTLVGELLAGRGDRALGVRRSAADPARFPILRGDIADPAWWDGVPAAARAHGLAWPVPAVLLAANPGVRRGRDNRLAEAARLARERLPDARLVYTGSTAVYADAGGADVDESGAVDAADPATAALLAIERAVLAHPRALALRIPALVGPTRTHALERLRAGERTVKGDLARPFSFLHERDCAEVCLAALDGALGVGPLNAASPERITAGDYHAALARAAGVPPSVGDGARVPSRWIDARRLQALLPRAWRSFAPTS
jgi:nucleoside-diphosphate-sugar epimerase